MGLAPQLRFAQERGLQAGFVVRDFLRRGFSVTSRVCATRKRHKRRAPAARIDDAKPTLCNTRLSGDFRLIPSLWLLARIS